MDRKPIIIAIAKAMAINNQAEEEKPPEYWTEESLFAHGYYSDAEVAWKAIIGQGMVIQPKKTPPKEAVEVVARALVEVFPNYRRISAGQAAMEFIEVLAQTRYEVRHVVGLPRG